MMKADWMAETATATGVLGVGFGIWWLVRSQPRSADILEHRPMKTDRSGPEPAIGKLRVYVQRLGWVETASFRLREVGHLLFGEVFVTPRGDPDNLPARIDRAVAGRASSTGAFATSP